MTTTKQFVGDPIDRAYAAMFTEQGSLLRSTLGYVGPYTDVTTTHDGKKYIALWAMPGLGRPPGILAVYRLLPNGALKRLVRWPAEVAARCPVEAVPQG